MEYRPFYRKIMRLSVLDTHTHIDIPPQVNAAELSSLDIVQAARNFANVCPGGLWWFDFRASIYRQVFQYRMEALPSARCAIVATDAYCIEWCYGKILLIKKLLADFLFEQISGRWLDERTALRVAEDWLHNTAQSLY